MQKILSILLILLAIACKKTVPISMVTATSMQNGLPFLALQGLKWMPESNAEFVKFHIYPDEAIQLSEVKLESCDNAFTSNIDMYINFDEMFQTLKIDGKAASHKFETPITARSVTLNFSKNSGICLNSVKFFDEKGKQLNLKGPRITEGSVKASETGNPESSYSVMNLFDSRYEYSYASLNNAKGVTIDFNFKDSQKVKAVRIWNGYQRSDVHCVENGRVKTITFTGDDNYSAKIELKDEMGGQTIQLPSEFKGKNLKMTIDEAYPGKKYRGIVLSEMRFFDGSDWFLIDPFPRIKEIAEANKAEFSKVSLEEILNKSIMGGDSVADTNSADGTRYASNWTVRLRTDGSMFLEGNTTASAGEGQLEQRFYALGNYEVKSTENDSIELRIFGFLRNNKNTIAYEHMDCNGCGRDCNQVYAADPNNIEKIFAEHIVITKNGDRYTVRNVKKTNNLDFDTLDMGME